MILLNWVRIFIAWTATATVSLLSALLDTLKWLRPKRRINIFAFDDCRPAMQAELTLFTIVACIIAFNAVAFGWFWLTILMFGSIGVMYYWLEHQFDHMEVAFYNAKPTERYIYLGRVLWMRIYREFRMMDVTKHVNDFQNQANFTMKVKGIK